ncbi:hypothetical protein [Oleiharenicola sp. Vm1]|uniref:hypothetical protein n=1 Tax=Oleiharenicola sp. Vm1 TaxID=3398393 RepID=UPI0039F51956
MKQILHLARKDLTRHWLVALLVIAAIVFDACDTLFGFAKFQYGIFDRDILMVFIKWPLGFLFVLAIAQEDVVVGEKSLWLTRPVHPSALLAAKLLTATAVIVGPQVGAYAIVCAALGSPAAVVAAVTLEILGISLALVLTALVVASLTRGVLQACLLTLATFLAVLATLLALRSLWPEFDQQRVLFSPVSSGTRFVAVVVLLALSLPALLVQHYHRRNAPVTAALAVAVLVATFVIGRAFPWEIVPPPHGGTAAPIPEAPTHTKVTFRLGGDAFLGGTVRRYDPATRAPRNHVLVSVPVQADFDRADRFADGIRTVSTVRFRDGTTKEFPAVGYTYLGHDQTYRALLTAIGLPAPAAKTEKLKSSPLALLSLAPGENPLPPEAPVDITARVSFVENEFYLAQTAPLSAHESFNLLGRAFRVADIRLSPEGILTLQLRSVGVTSLLYPAATARPDGLGGPSSSGTEIGLVLRNRKRNEFASGGVTFVRDSEAPGIFGVSRAMCTFTWRRGAQMSKPAAGLSPEWLADAELMVFRIRRLGLTEQTIELHNVSVAREDPLPIRLW